MSKVRFCGQWDGFLQGCVHPCEELCLVANTKSQHHILKMDEGTQVLTSSLHQVFVWTKLCSPKIRVKALTFSISECDCICR